MQLCCALSLHCSNTRRKRRCICDTNKISVLSLLDLSGQIPGRTSRRGALPQAFQSFDHTDILALIEERLLCDNIALMLIERQRLFVVQRHVQCDFGVVLLSRLLLSCLQQTGADPLVARISEYSERIDVPF